MLSEQRFTASRACESVIKVFSVSGSEQSKFNPGEQVNTSRLACCICCAHRLRDEVHVAASMQRHHYVDALTFTREFQSEAPIRIGIAGSGGLHLPFVIHYTHECEAMILRLR